MHNCSCNNKSMFTGNSVNITIDKNSCESEIRADLYINESDTIRVWGIVKNSCGQPVQQAQIKLMKVHNIGNKKQYQHIAQTLSDCQGFYQFDLECDEDLCCYKLTVKRSKESCDQTVDSCTMECTDFCDCCTKSYYRQDQCTGYEYY